MIEIALSKRQADELSEHVETHMMHCFNSVNEDTEEEVPPEFEPFGVYCGCGTCDAREYFMSMIQWLRANEIADVYVGG